MDWHTFNLSLGLHVTAYVVVALFRVVHRAMSAASEDL